MISHFTRTALAGAAFAVCSAGAAAAYPATVTQDLNLRSGPSTGYGVLTTMPAGAQVDVGNCLSNGWCELNFAGARGYASASYLSRGPRSSSVVVVEPDTAFEPYYTYWDTYPPYWDNGFFYYYTGNRYVRTRRDRDWWDHHRGNFARYHARRGVPPHFSRGNPPPMRHDVRPDHRGREFRGADHRGPSPRFNAGPRQQAPRPHRDAGPRHHGGNMGQRPSGEHRAAPHRAGRMPPGATFGGAQERRNH